MRIVLSPLKYKFRHKPLLVGGKAMEFYKLRRSGKDTDFIVSGIDYKALSEQYSKNLKDLYGDLGVVVGEFEIWKSIRLLDYRFLSVGAIERDSFLVISLERLMFLKALAISEKKYEEDVRLIVEKINNILYGKDKDFPADFFSQTSLVL